MKTGIYFRNIREQSKEIISIANEVNYIICGDYGCVYSLPELSELEKLSSYLQKIGTGLLYISPKVDNKSIAFEEERVLKLLQLGVCVSINDFGLLYKIKNKLSAKSKIYLGRLLTKSIEDWPFWILFLQHETNEVKDYLLQNNFNHKIKIDYFKEMNIKGIEVNYSQASAASYAEIKKKGFEVISYVDNSILAVSRACPLTRLDNKFESHKSECKNNCSRGYPIESCNKSLSENIKSMELIGNVLYQFEDNNADNFNECDLYIYYKTSNISTLLKDTIFCID